jgi:hypothetical protein
VAVRANQSLASVADWRRPFVAGVSIIARRLRPFANRRSAKDGSSSLVTDATAAHKTSVSGQKASFLMKGFAL